MMDIKKTIQRRLILSSFFSISSFAFFKLLAPFGRTKNQKNQAGFVKLVRDVAGQNFNHLFFQKQFTNWTSKNGFKKFQQDMEASGQIQLINREMVEKGYRVTIVFRTENDFKKYKTFWDKHTNLELLRSEGILIKESVSFLIS